jgi:hypothetical protein
VDSDRIEGEKKQQEGKLQETWGEAKDKARDIKDDVEDALDRDDDDELVEDRREGGNTGSAARRGRPRSVFRDVTSGYRCGYSSTLERSTRCPHAE